MPLKVKMKKSKVKKMVEKDFSFLLFTFYFF